MMVQTFASHLGELRSRLVQCVVWLILWSSIGYYFRHQIETVLLKPIDHPLFYSSPIGGLEIAVNLSLYVGLLATMPIIIYHFTKFVEPILPKNARYSVFWFVVASSLLACAGVVFAYYITIPRTLHFLEAFKSDQIQPLIATDKYLSFVAFYLIGSALAFQMPVVVVLVNSLARKTLRQLLSFERYIIVASFIIGAIITFPNPDPFNQTLLALVLIALYQISIIIVWIINRKRKVTTSLTAKH